ncbi:MAG: hypothetical protein WDW38_007095 [Sanguina aurantia]
MPFGQLVIGPPGSGKTTYCNGMQQFMRAAGRKVEIVNLDPANDGLPYLPAIDLSDLVGLEEVMEEFKLGPNGANTYILFDCPGQVELFTMHGSFQSIIKTITGDWAYRLTAVHLVDAHLCTDPSKFVSGLLLSLSTMLHLELPHVNVLSKIDLVRQYGQLAFNLDYFTEVQDMSHLMATMGDDMFSKRFRKLTRGLCECVEDFGLVSFVPLAIQDKDSIQRLLVLVDKANGHVYAAMAGHSPYPAELLYGSAPLGTDKDMWMTYQERYLEGEVAERVIDEERVGVYGLAGSPPVTAATDVMPEGGPGAVCGGASAELPGFTITELMEDKTTAQPEAVVGGGMQEAQDGCGPGAACGDGSAGGGGGGLSLTALVSEVGAVSGGEEAREGSSASPKANTAGAEGSSCSAAEVDCGEVSTPTVTAVEGLVIDERRPPDNGLSGVTAQNKGHAAALRSFASVAAAQSDASRPHELEGKVLHPSLLNDNVLKTEYAVRGELYLRAEQLRKEGKEIMFTNVGNPHALGAKPMTFTRQVLALCAAPFLLDHPQVETMFPADAIARARRLLSSFKGGMGAYTDSRGNPMVREEVAKFIERRDNVPSNPDHIFLTDGASVAVRMCLNATIRSPLDGILVPIPQYPLYSASIKLYGGALVAYYLDEKRGWALDTADMKRAVEEARAEGKSVRGLVFINPGNPTGQCLSVDNLKELIKFAYDERIVLMADEVYQENIYQDERPFVSAKKVLSTMGEPYASGTELLSFHTISKGTGGECGLRGGYVEMTNIHPGTIEEVYKCASINLSPNTMGQIAMSILMNPPKPGDESYETWATERGSELSSLRRRAQMVTDGFNAMEGMTCNFTEGAMYSFPQVGPACTSKEGLKWLAWPLRGCTTTGDVYARVSWRPASAVGGWSYAARDRGRSSSPAKAMAAADAAGKAGDVFYCLKLLESTGISTVPGSGFGQEEGTFHLRTTILPREELMPAFVEKFKSFHSGFMQQYR